MPSRGRSRVSDVADVAIGMSRIFTGMTQPRRVGPRGVVGMVAAIGRHGLTTAAIGAMAIVLKLGMSRACADSITAMPTRKTDSGGRPCVATATALSVAAAPT